LATYSYVAFELSGRRLTGTVDAPDQSSAMAIVASSGAKLLEISERASSGSTSAKKQSVSRAELALLTRRLADLSAAGLPLDRSLQLSGEQSDNIYLQQVTLEATKDVRGGVPISDALAKYPDLFPSVFTMTLKAGEASGQFPQVAARLAELQQTEVRRRSQFIGALTYPAILAATCVVVVLFLMLFIIPKLSGVFNDLGSELPASTRLLLSASDFTTHNGALILIALVALVVVYQGYMRSAQGQYSRDRILLNMPLVGKIVTKAAISRYARVLGTLIYGGVPILESLRIAGAAVGNRVLEASGTEVQKSVREGHRIADAMRDTGVFSNVLVQMVAVGEETGDLPTMLSRVSESMDFDVDTGVQKLTSLLEPIMVLAMGGFVGFVVISILLPVYEAQDLVK